MLLSIQEEVPPRRQACYLHESGTARHPALLPRRLLGGTRPPSAPARPRRGLGQRGDSGARPSPAPAPKHARCSLDPPTSPALASRCRSRGERSSRPVTASRSSPRSGLSGRSSRVRIPSRAVPTAMRFSSPSNRSEARPRVPAFVAATQLDFHACPLCGRVFWKGTHAARLLDVFAQAAQRCSQELARSVQKSERETRTLGSRAPEWVGRKEPPPQSGCASPPVERDVDSRIQRSSCIKHTQPSSHSMPRRRPPADRASDTSTVIAPPASLRSRSSFPSSSFRSGSRPSSASPPRSRYKGHSKPSSRRNRVQARSVPP